MNYLYSNEEYKMGKSLFKGASVENILLQMKNKNKLDEIY